MSHVSLIYRSLLCTKEYNYGCSSSDMGCSFEFAVLGLVLSPLEDSSFGECLSSVYDVFGDELFEFVFNLNVFWFSLSLSDRRVDYLVELFNRFPDLFERILSIRDSFFRDLSLGELLDISRRLKRFEFRLEFWVRFIFPKLIPKFVLRGFNLEALLDLIGVFSRRVSSIGDPLEFLCRSLDARNVDFSLLIKDVAGDKIAKFKRSCFKFRHYSYSLSKVDVIDYVKENYIGSVFKVRNIFSVRLEFRDINRVDYLGKFTILRFPFYISDVVRLISDLSISELKGVFKRLRRVLLWRDYVEVVLYTVRKSLKKKSNFVVPVDFDFIFPGFKRKIRVLKEGRLVDVPNVFLFGCSESFRDTPINCLTLPLIILFAADLRRRIESYQGSQYKELSEDQFIFSIYSRIREFYKFLRDYWGLFPALYMLLIIFDTISEYEKLIKLIKSDLKISNLFKEHGEETRKLLSSLLDAISADIANKVMAEEMSEGYDSLYSVFRLPIWEKFSEALVSLISLSVYSGDVGVLNEVLGKLIEHLADKIQYKDYIYELVKKVSNQLPGSYKSQFISIINKNVKQLIFESNDTSYLNLLKGLTITISSEELMHLVKKFHFLSFPGDSEEIFSLLGSVDSISDEALRSVFDHIHFDVSISPYNSRDDYQKLLLKFIELVISKAGTKELALKLLIEKFRELGNRILSKWHLSDEDLTLALAFISTIFVLKYYHADFENYPKLNKSVEDLFDSHLLFSLLERGIEGGVDVRDLLGNFLSMRYLEIDVIGGDPGGTATEYVDVSLVDLFLNKLSLRVDHWDVDDLIYVFVFKAIFLLKLWLYEKDSVFSDMTYLLDQTLKDLVLLKYGERTGWEEFLDEQD